MDSPPENFLPMGDPQKHAEKVQWLLSEMDDECRWIISLMRASGTPEDELWEEARRMVRSNRKQVEKQAFEYRLIERITAGEILAGYELSLVRAAFQRLFEQAVGINAESFVGPPSPASFSAQEQAQKTIALIAKEFFRVKGVDQDLLRPWLVEVWQTPGFQKQWERLFHQSKKRHTRETFEFCLSRLIALDEQVLKFVRAVGPKTDFTSAEDFNEAALAFVEEVGRWSKPMSDAISTIAHWFEEQRATCQPAYLKLSLDPWTIKRMEDKQACVAVAMPYLLAEWQALKPASKERIQPGRKEPANIGVSIRNCVETIYEEFHAPPIIQDAKGWLIDRHA